MILITGGAGFIGLNFTKYLLQKGYNDILVIDKLSYVSHPHELLRLNCQFNQVNIISQPQVSQLFENDKIDTIFHFAAESHVDNSIKSCMPFVYNNIIGTINLLDQAVKHGVKKFFHISTDEVFGHILYGTFNENTKINPRNPYSASKASAEHFVRAYGNTYGLQYQIVNMSNNYGPFQYPEKLIPLTIRKCLQNEKVPVYGQGEQIRDWIYVEDTCDAILTIHEKGATNESYCISAEEEHRNIDVVHTILKKMGLKRDCIEFVNDRAGHDFRYATNMSKLKQLGWSPQWDFGDGLDKTIEWVKQYENSDSRLRLDRAQSI